MLLLTFVIGPVMPFLPSPDTELVGDSLGALVLNEVMAWLTPGARVNCSRNSTLVRPLAANTKKDVSLKNTHTRKQTSIYVQLGNCS